MRKLFLSIMVSLDGFASGPDGELAWIEVEDPELEQHMLTNVLQTIDTQIFGRVAYELLAGYWPHAESEPASDGEREQAKLVNSIPKLVLSRGSGPLTWGPATRLNGDIAGQIKALKREPGKDIALFAGPETASVFMKLDLIDEYRIMVYPVVLGAGRSPFPAPADRLDLKLEEAKTFLQSGVVILRYVRP
jgi:dihydrofolate reductase